MFNRFSILLLITLFSTSIEAQTIGGSSVFNFLKITQHPIAAASGGRLVSGYNKEVGLINENAAFLREETTGCISTNVSMLSPGLNLLNAVGAYHFENKNINLALGITHMSYGNDYQTDASGNVLGTFNPVDQAVQLNYGGVYNDNWFYGAALKYIHSRYGTYVSNAIAADAGILYSNDERTWNAGFSVRNMGAQLRAYAIAKEDMPFDMAIGISKLLEYAPFRFSLTGQKIHQFDLMYNDTLFNVSNGLSNKERGAISKIIDHLILSGDWMLGEKITVSLGYNFLRRKELAIERLSNGFTGFSYGMSLSLKRVKFNFSRSHLQTNIAYLHAGITCDLKAD